MIFIQLPGGASANARRGGPPLARRLSLLPVVFLPPPALPPPHPQQAPASESQRHIWRLNDIVDGRQRESAGFLSAPPPPPPPSRHHCSDTRKHVPTAHSHTRCSHLRAQRQREGRRRSDRQREVRKGHPTKARKERDKVERKGGGQLFQNKMLTAVTVRPHTSDPDHTGPWGPAHPLMLTLIKPPPPPPPPAQLSSTTPTPASGRPKHPLPGVTVWSEA